MSTVRWLHISDLHLNTPGYSSAFLRDELPKFLRRSGIRCDYIFCTGDLRDARKGVFPSDNGQFLQELCDAVGTDNLFVVPGNHDVNRGNAGEERDEAVQRILQYYDTTNGIIEDADLEILHRSQQEFRDYISCVLPPAQMSFYDSPHFSIETAHFNILHVDSTMAYTINHESNLILGMDPLYAAVKSINKKKPTILLTHYAYSMLAQEERKAVREMLYHNGIQLWLAGHEHEHNLQPISYLHSIQSGELRLEDKCNTSVLVGEFDTEALVGRIQAYAWFDEGWYLYPAIWHGEYNGFRRDDEYPFILRLQESDELRSLEAINSHKHNQKYKRSYQLLDSLFADVEKDGQVYRNADGLVDCLKDTWNSHEQIVLIADGGMGKTTRLLAACDDLAEKPAVYIPLEGTDPEYLIRDICRALFAASSEERLYQFAKERHTDPDVYLFLDGMNEVSADQEKAFISVIKRIPREYPGIMMVISSRSNFTERYRLDGFSIGRIKPLREDQIKELFTASEWVNIESNPPLKKLVQNPLMATLYKRVSPEIGKEHDVIRWIDEITNETELLYDFYLTQLFLSVGKDINVAQYINRCLPYIAYCFEHQARHTVTKVEFEAIIKNAAALVADESLEVFRRQYRVRSAENITEFNLEDYLLNVSHLLHEADGIISFPHQIHRDYLSAVWLTKTEELLDAWNERYFTTTVSEHIRVLCGDRYWDGLAKTITDHARNREDCKNLIINVINTFPYEEGTGAPDFIDLDFRGIRLPDYGYLGEKIRLVGTKLDEFSIGCEAGEILLLSGLSFSPDNEYLAGVSDGEIIVYSMDIGQKVFRESVYADGRHIGKAYTHFSSDSKYLFIRKNQDLIIFEKDDGSWRRAGVASGVYVKKLHNAVIHDGVVSFYYTKRIKSFSLQTGELVEDLDIYHPYENPAEGEDIAKIEPSGSPRGDNEYAVAVSGDNQYRAICYQDGRLIVTYRGGKLLHSLEIGKGVLLAAAISKDGNRAVTLSANTYRGQRRIQLWDLDRRQRVDERFCNAEINKLFLTDHGDWIIGIEDQRCCFWNWESNGSFTREVRFISETEHGLTTYGNCLLYQDGSGILQELNLDDQTTRSLGKYPPILFATVLPNGKVAFVGSSGRYVEFDSTTTGYELKLNRETAKINNVHAFKTQPFIAVLTAGGLVSMYHIGTGQRTRKLQSHVGYRLVAFHPDQNVFSFSDRNRQLETYRYFEWQTRRGERRGKWCEPRRPDFDVEGKIIAIGFNTDQEEQIMIETNGKITYMQDRFCDFHSQTKVITNFSVNAYDFDGVVCSDDVKEQLARNGA